MTDIRCIGCHKAPEQIADTVERAEAEHMRPSDYVAKLDTTYNETNGHFLCTDCYLEAGISDPAYRAP